MSVFVIQNSLFLFLFLLKTYSCKNIVSLINNVNLRKGFFRFMSKILITGNGFDLFHGLPTKYGHFMAVMEVIENIEEKEEYDYYDLFDEDFVLDYFNDDNKMRECFDVDKIKFSKDSIDEIKLLLEENIWYNHFKTVLELDTWIDFEMEIFKFLEEICLFVDELKEKSIFKLASQSHNFDFLNFFLIDDYDSEYFDRKSKLDLNKILIKLTNSLNVFKEIFNKYLNSIVLEFYQYKLDKTLKLPYNLMNEIYTFNYTPTIEKFYTKNIIEIAYLHGSIDKSNIVLGVNEIPDLVKKGKGFDFTKNFQKIKNSTNKKFIRIPDENKNNLKETIFYIIGHSLDESDKGYIKDLFKFLQNDKNKFSKIVIFYFDENDYNSKLNNLFKILNEEIVVEMDKNGRLCFVELNNENITKEFNRKLKDKISNYPTYSN